MSILITPEEEELAKQLEAVLSPKQAKVVNFLVGKTMGAYKAAKLPGSPDPKFIRQLLILKLSLLTYEEEEVPDGS